MVSQLLVLHCTFAVHHVSWKKLNPYVLCNILTTISSHCVNVSQNVWELFFCENGINGYKPFYVSLYEVSKMSCEPAKILRIVVYSDENCIKHIIYK